MNPELLHELPLLGEHLNPVAAALADVNEPIAREVDAVQRGRELRLIRRRPRDVIRRCGVIVDLAQRDAFASPSALECAGIHVVHEDSLVQEPVRNEDLARVLVELERSDTRRKHGRLLVVLLDLIGGNLWSAVAEVPDKLPVARKLDDAVAGRCSRQVDVLVTVHGDRLQSPRPAGVVVRASPCVDDFPVLVELQNLRSEDTAVAPGRGRHGVQFVGARVRTTIDDPDVIVAVDVHVDDLLHAPFVRQRLRPEGIDFVGRAASRCRLLGARSRVGRQGSQAAHPDSRGCDPGKSPYRGHDGWARLYTAPIPDRYRLWRSPPAMTCRSTWATMTGSSAG